MPDGKLVLERFLPPSGPAVMRYFTLDHLGSVAVVTDENGAVLTDGNGYQTGRLSYDAFGAMRNLDASADTTCSLRAQEGSTSGGVTRGFTSQEEMPNVCLINYNAPILMIGASETSPQQSMSSCPLGGVGVGSKDTLQQSVGQFSTSAGAAKAGLVARIV